MEFDVIQIWKHIASKRLLPQLKKYAVIDTVSLTNG